MATTETPQHCAMLDASNNNETLRAQLVETYRALPLLEQKMVQLFSVIYEPVNKVTFLDCFSRSGIKDQQGKSSVGALLRPSIDNLLRKGLILIPQRSQGPQCHPLLAEIATRDAVKAGEFELWVKALQISFPIRTSWKNGPRAFSSERQFIREVRIGIYSHDIKFINQQFEDYYRYGYAQNRISMDEIFQRVCNNPFDADWFRTLPSELYENGLFSILFHSAQTLAPANEAFELLKSECAQPDEDDNDSMRLVLIEQLLLRGRFQEAQQNLERVSEEQQHNADVLRGWLSFVRGEEGAIAHFSFALKMLKKATGKRQIFFGTTAGLFFILALLKDGSPQYLREATEYASFMTRQAQHWLKALYGRLHSLLLFQQGDLSQKDFLGNLYLAANQSSNSLETLFTALCVYWADADKAKKNLPRLLEPFCERAAVAGYDWLRMETAELLARLKPRSSYSKAIAALRQAMLLDDSVPSLAALIQPQESWELSLKALANLQKEPQVAVKTDSQFRLIWLVTFYDGSCILQPREQKVNASGNWSKGRAIALKRLSENRNEFDYLTPQDRRICEHIQNQYGNFYGSSQYEFADTAIVELVGHPLVFWEDAPTVRVDVVKGEPELLVKKGKQDQLILEFVPKIKETHNVLVIKETPTRLKVIEVKPEHRRIAEIIGRANRLEVPAAAKERVLTAISAVSGIVTVHSDIGGGVQSAEEVPADSKPHVHLLPAGSGLKVAVLARPFAQGGPYYRPGSGGETVIAEIEGKRLQTTRNLKEEKKLAKAVVENCPTLLRQAEEDGEWLIEESEDCLELLLELQALGDSIRIEWPEGEKLRVNHRADLNAFQVKIQRQNDWFEASGELKLSDDLVLNMQQLMELLNKTSSRFIPLGDGQFLALTQAFRKRLDELRAFSEGHGKGVRFHPLASLALEEFVDEVGDLKADKHWKEHIKRLKEMQTLQPQLPSTLQAELRDYQIEGFDWLARLAHWGVGACLADDMGLGKTLQALALILTRAPEGPTLIVAPTSVCMNWVSEAQKFAPTLNVIQFGTGDRQTTLAQLNPLDMLVCSYGLLQQDEVAEMLAQVQWQTIVLDEAQAIKNTATKRSQAAMRLQGRFKLLTTGTPIENHLGELWNLFRFINPGLLGSMERFNQRFATPIEKYQDKAARNQLKKLIQPFILRRTKNQVLEELPSRTEIALQVELSKEEMAMYEALRRDAIAKLSNSDATAGAKHLQVLAEIMKLRRMCCNPQLVMPDAPVSSSKLQLFGEVLEELLENRHKALVFSQFVDHLAIIRNYLDKQNISYQYLDGSTPVKERKKRVDAFQAGEGDVFLISLKAGGTGLNLTAADYVIHMDPWWNPAVEDQASDRAHRIGQMRPVTIYRLVAKGTIEEKIVDLHQHKRDLADSLLEGTDASGKISTDDLLRLISAG